MNSRLHCIILKLALLEPQVVKPLNEQRRRL